MAEKPASPDPDFGSHVRLSSIEAFHLHSACEQWPNCITGRFHFTGLVDIELARQAWLHCLSRQIFTNWFVESRGRAKWKVNKDTSHLEKLAESLFHDLTIEQWPECETQHKLPRVNSRGLPAIDAAKDAGFAMWCVRSTAADRTTVFFSADHMLGDGAGALAFAREWLIVYHNLVNGDDVNRGLVKFDWRRWKSRSKLGLFRWSFLKFLPCQAIGLFGATKFVLRKFSTIDPVGESTATYDSPGMIGHTISPQLLNRLNDRAERLSVSPNSLLMTILFRTMKQIQTAVDAETSPTSKWSDRKWLRLVLPISIRSLADRKLPCTNKASLVQVERTLEQVADADGAAQSIDREVRIIMGFKLDLVFLIAIRILSVIPALLKFVAGNQKSRGTVVFTNLGEPFRKARVCDFQTVGNMELVDYDLCGPIRCGTPINFSWLNFRRKTDDERVTHARVSLHFDRSVVPHETAQTILQAFVKELEDVSA